MSQQSIADKSQVIRQETQQHANTRGRVADVIDDINETKANKTDIDEVDGDLSAHLGDFNNPHNVTKSQVGLGNADNTADIDKPISTAVQAELDDIRTEIEGQTEWNENQDNRLDQLEQHNIDQDLALGDRAKLDASNLTAGNVDQWRAKLNVPENPDSVIRLGKVTADSSTAYLALHTSGANAVLIDGVVYSRTDAQTFPFTPVTTGQKILIIYALPDAQVFHLAQGAESTEAVEPAYSGLFVARLLVTLEGIDIIQATSGFREKSVDNFAIYSLTAGDRVLGIGSQMRLKVQSAGAIRIGGFYNEEDKVYNGCPISVRNDTPFDMEFYNAVDSSLEFMPINPDDLPFSIKPGETANFAYRGGGMVEIIKTGTTGDLTLEQARLNGNILEGDVIINNNNQAFTGLVLNHYFGGKSVIGYTDDGFPIIKTSFLLDEEVTSVDYFFEPDGLYITGNVYGENFKGIRGSEEFDKQGDRKAFAQLSDVYDAITTETNARIAADKIETVVIALSPFNEDLLDNTSRLGFGVLTFPIKVLSFQTSAYPVPTGSGITTDLRKNGTSVATSVISAGATNSTGNPPPTFSADTFAIGDRLNFFTPTGGIGSTVKGQNLVATLIIERL